jgi:hypothetical protein
VCIKSATLKLEDTVWNPAIDALRKCSAEVGEKGEEAEDQDVANHQD